MTIAPGKPSAGELADKLDRIAQFSKENAVQASSRSSADTWRTHAEGLHEIATALRSRDVAGAEGGVREAFRAGWFTNAGTDVQPPEPYLISCEEVDWLDYKKTPPSSAMPEREAFAPFLQAAGGVPQSINDAAPFARVSNDARTPGTFQTISMGEFRRLVAALSLSVEQAGPTTLAAGHRAPDGRVLSGCAVRAAQQMDEAPVGRTHLGALADRPKP